MTTALDTKFAGVALAIIEKFGTTGLFETLAPGGMDKRRGERKPGVTSTTSRKCSPVLDEENELVDSSTRTVMNGHIFIAASGLTFTPTTGMHVTVNGSRWKMGNVRRLISGDDVAAYDVDVSR